jgi:hypothetical protein
MFVLHIIFTLECVTVILQKPQKGLFISNITQLGEYQEVAIELIDNDTMLPQSSNP